MAALPLTGISTSMVAQAIGEASNDVGTLFLSTKVNAWGFNPPGASNLNAVWGKSIEERTKLSPTAVGFTPIPNVVPGYHLGYFRGYDHDWVTYKLDGLGKTDKYFNSSGSYVNEMEFKLFLAPCILNKPTPSPAIDHIFKIEFARSEDAFNAGTAILIDDNFSVQYPYNYFLIDGKYPPDYDTNGQLDDGEVFYIKVAHISSPERRWFATSLDTHIFSFTTPANPFTNTYYLQNIGAHAVNKPFPTPAIVLFDVYADLYADYEVGRLMNFHAQMSDTSDFSANVYDVYINNVSVPMNETPGTRSFVQHLNFDFSGSGINQVATVGDTVYYRIYVDNVLYNTWSIVVTNVPPQD
jgi:hypothetical protein